MAGQPDGGGEAANNTAGKNDGHFCFLSSFIGFTDDEEIQAYSSDLLIYKEQVDIH